MSEVHYELREALFDDVVTADKAQWVIEEVNRLHDVPAFTRLRDDSARYAADIREFTMTDLKHHAYAQEFLERSTHTGYKGLSELVESLPKTLLDKNQKSVRGSTEELILRPDPAWKSKRETEESDDDDGFGFLM